jgi:hypothetical protein
VAPVPAGEPAAIELQAPAVLVVGGHSGTITVTVRDADGQPVANGTAVLLETTLGHLSRQHLRTQYGRASAELTSGHVPGTAVVSAVSGESQAETLVEFVSGPADEVILDAWPEAPTVGETVALTVTVRDALGNRVADGYPVALTTDLGVVSPTVSSTELGRVHAEWSSRISGSGVVTVTADAASASLSRSFAPGEPWSVTLIPERSRIGVLGEVTVVTATVRDRFGNSVEDHTAVRFSASGGSVSPDAATTIEGTARTRYSSGAVPGSYEVAAVAGAASGRCVVELRPSDLVLTGVALGPRGKARETRTYPGELVTYTLTTANGDLATARDVVLGVSLPDALAVRSVEATRPVTPTDSSGGPALAAPEESVERHWQLPPLGSGEALTLTITGRLERDSRPWSSFQTLFLRSAVTTTTPEASTDDQQHTDQIAVYGADHFIGIELDSSASRVEPGGVLVYDISYGNTTSGVDGTVRITDTLPAYTSYDHWQPGPATSIRQVGWFGSTSRELVWEADGPDATTGRLRLWLRIAGNALPEQVLENQVQIGADVYDVDMSNNTASDGGVWLRGVNLVAEIDVADATWPSQVLPVAIVVENRSVRDGATEVVLSGRPPEGLRLLSTSPPALVMGDGSVVWRRSRLPSGARMSVVMELEVPESAVPGTVYRHAVEVSSAEPESYPADNSQRALTTVVAGQPDSIEVTSADSEIIACSTSSTVVSALVRDEWGNAVDDGSVVEWSTSLGSLERTTTVLMLP